MNNFGKKLRNLRKANHLTQKQLAERIGVRNSIISFYEVEERTPSIEIIIKLAKTFHVTTDYLLGIDKNESADLTGLNEEDKTVILSMIELLRKKNKKQK